MLRVGDCEKIGSAVERKLETILENQPIAMKKIEKAKWSRGQAELEQGSHMATLPAVIDQA
tara:strand:- start:287 stop:469 length:183 start_codon:yes stop_codon:yes gene_type:complete